jgi:hypothetical protein
MTPLGVLRRLRARGKAALGKGADQLDVLRSRFVFKAFDAVLTAGLKRTSPSAVSWTPRSNYRRAQATMEVVQTLFPGAAALAGERLFRPQRLPFAHHEVELLSLGTACTVFLLRPTEPNGTSPPMVLKVFRKMMGRRPEVVLNHVRALRARYEMIAAWYSDCSLVVPTHFMVLHGPLLGRPVAACVQPYLETERRDFFTVALDDRLPGRIRESESLRRQFRTFVGSTFRILSAERLSVDLVGSDNLLLSHGQGEPRLQLLDFGVHDHSALRAKAPQRLAVAEERLARLRRIYEQVFDEPVLDEPCLPTAHQER